MSELLKKYESIDQSKLNEATVKILNRVKSITVDFTAEDEKNNKIAEQVLNEVMKKNPDAVKIVSSSPKAKPAPKAKPTPKKTHKTTHKAKHVLKTSQSNTTATSAKKSGNNIMSVAKEIQKDGESWKDAIERAKNVLKDRKEQGIEKKKTELDKLLNLVRTKKELQGFANSDIDRDSRRTALPRGRRVSKDGNVYYENRENRTDRLAPNYPQDMPLLASGGMLKIEDSGDSWKNLLGYDPYFEQDVIVATFSEEEKIVRPNHGYFYPNAMAKKVIRWAEKNGYEFIQDGKKYDNGGSVSNERMYNFLKDDLEKLEIAINESDNEEVERFFSYWLGSSGHLKSLKTENNDRMYIFLKDDLDKLQIAISENNTEEIEKFFSYWGQHLESLKFANGGSLPYMTDPNFGNFQNTGSFADGGLVVSNSNDLEDVAKYMTNAVKKHKWDLKDLIFYFEKENNFDYKHRVKIWDEMNGYEMKKTYENILEMLKRIVESNDKKFAEGGSVGSGKNGYVAFYKGKQIDVYADTKYEAQKIASQHFKAKKDYDVNVVLAELDGKPYVNSTSFADGGYFDKLEDVKFLFNVGEKIKIPQMENGKSELVDAEIIQQYPAQQNDETYYPFYYVKGSWENAKKTLYNEEELLEYGNKPKTSFECGGSFMTDLAGHTGGSYGMGKTMPLSGVSGTNYTGLVGETGAMSSGELFENGGDLHSKELIQEQEKSLQKIKQLKIDADKKKEKLYNLLQLYVDGVLYADEFKNKFKAIFKDGGSFKFDYEDESYETYNYEDIKSIFNRQPSNAKIIFYDKAEKCLKDKSLVVLAGYYDGYNYGFFEEGGAMMQNQQVMNDASQHYVNYYLGEGASQGIYKKGGSIPNNYEGRTAEDIWNNLTVEQRKHFISDHSGVIKYVKRNYKGLKDYHLITDEIKHQNNNWKNLDSDIKLIFKEHVEEGQYAYGGKTKSKPSMKELYVEQIASLTRTGKSGVESFVDDYNLTDSDLSNLMTGLGRGLIDKNDFVTAIVGTKNNLYAKSIVAFAKSDKAYKLADGGSLDDEMFKAISDITEMTMERENKAYIALQNKKDKSDIIFEPFDKYINNRDDYKNYNKVYQAGVKHLDGTPYYANGGAFAPNVSNGTEFTNGVYAEGGAINGELNKKIKALSEKKGITIDKLGVAEYNKVITQALVESLTDANMHEEARELVSKAENKEWSDELYKSVYYNPSKKVEDFARKVAIECSWELDDILNAYYFITKMEGSKVASIIENLFLKSSSFTPSIEFNVGDIVWDKGNKRYGTVMNNYGDPINGESGEIRLDSDGNQYIFSYDKKNIDRTGYNLVKLGYQGDEGKFTNDILADMKASANRLIDSRRQSKDKDGVAYYKGVYKRLLDGEFDSMANGTSKPKKYIDHDDIKSVTVIYKGKQTVFKGEDVLNGANLLEEGGDLSKIAFYIPKRDLVSAELKNGETIKPANGYWIKKGAEPIFDEGGFMNNVYADGGYFDDNNGFMEAKNGNNYRYPNRPVNIDVVDEPIDLSSSISSRTNEVVIQPLNENINLNEDGRIRARKTQSGTGSAEKLMSVNPRMTLLDFPKLKSSQHKND